MNLYSRLQTMEGCLASGDLYALVGMKLNLYPCNIPIFCTDAESSEPLICRYVSIGDVAHVGIHPPHFAAIYKNVNGNFVLPLGYDLVSVQ